MSRKNDPKIKFKTYTQERFVYDLVGRSSLEEFFVVDTIEKQLKYNEETQRYLPHGTGRIINSNYKGNTSYPLRIISLDELKILRYYNSGFVLKDNNVYYYTDIPASTRLLHLEPLKCHKCAPNPYTCTHLSAAPDQYGGCAKVRNRSKNIELYDFITLGYETFNTSLDVFSVARCLNHEIHKSSK